MKLQFLLNFTICIYCFTGDNERVEGTGHGNQINGMCCEADYVYTCGIDDSLRQISVDRLAYTDLSVKLGSQPRAMDVHKDIIVTANVNQVILLSKFISKGRFFFVTIISIYLLEVCR